MVAAVSSKLARDETDERWLRRVRSHFNTFPSRNHWNDRNSVVVSKLVQGSTKKQSGNGCKHEPARPIKYGSIPRTADYFDNISSVVELRIAAGDAEG